MDMVNNIKKGIKMNRKGFTLIELVICIMILIILGFMGITAFFGMSALKNASDNSNTVIIQQQDESKFDQENRY